MLVDVLADDDRIVDNDAQRHEKREHGEHVQRMTEVKHDRAGTEDGNRNAQRHPEGQPHFEKDRQHKKDENQPLDAVTHQHSQPVAYIDRLVHPHGHFVAGRQGTAGCVGSHVVGHGKQVFARRTIDRNHHAGPTVDATDGVGIFKLVAYGPEIANG